jgi:hypothetical protein
MKTSKKCEDCNEALCFTPKRNGFQEILHICSISIKSGVIWLDYGCAMWVLKAGGLVGSNLSTGKGISFVIAVFLIKSYTHYLINR